MLKGSSKPVERPEGRWPWHPVLVVLFVIALFVMTQFVAAIVATVLAMLTGDSSLESPKLFGDSVLFQFAYILIAEGLTLGGLALFLRGRGIGLKSLGLRRPRLSDAGWAVIAFMVYTAAYVMLVSVLSPLVPGLDVDQRQDIGFDDAAGVVPLILVFLALVVLAPVTEEIMMRGFLFTSLRQRTPFWLSTAIVSTIFALLHLSGGEEGSGLIWIAAIDTFVLSVALCYLREKTGRLWASIGLHAIKNGVAFFVLFVVGS